MMKRGKTEKEQSSATDHSTLLQGTNSPWLFTPGETKAFREV